MYQIIPTSYKHKFPFKLSTTSFIYPDSFVPNVKLLAPCFDEIELLFFEGIKTENLPDKEEIELLAEIGNENNLTYNIHLPTDISISSEDPKEQMLVVDTIKHIFELTYPLEISTYTLHLPFQYGEHSEKTVKKWHDRVDRNFDQIILSGLSAEKISLENLDYPIEWIDVFVKEKKCKFCLDLGHLIVHGIDPETVFKRYKNNTSILHIHGVEFSKTSIKDHVSLDNLYEEKKQSVLNILNLFEKVVSIEVFSYENLISSLEFLDTSLKY